MLFPDGCFYCFEWKYELKFLCIYAVALFRYVNGRGNVTYLLFDSHCRNSRGITDGGPGFSILIKFQSLFQIERCIEEYIKFLVEYIRHILKYSLFRLNVSVDDLAMIQSPQISYFRRIKRQQKQVKENLQETQDRKYKKNPKWQNASQIQKFSKT